MKKQKALKMLANFIIGLPLTFELDISLCLLQNKIQTKGHDYALLIREPTETFFKEDDVRDLSAMIALFKQRLKDKVDFKITRVRHKGKIWNCLYIDLMPEIKEKFSQLMGKAKT